MIGISKKLAFFRICQKLLDFMKNLESIFSNIFSVLQDSRKVGPNFSIFFRIGFSDALAQLWNHLEHLNSKWVDVLAGIFQQKQLFNTFRSLLSPKMPAKVGLKTNLPKKCWFWFKFFQKRLHKFFSYFLHKFFSGCILLLRKNLNGVLHCCLRASIWKFFKLGLWC